MVRNLSNPGRAIRPSAIAIGAITVALVVTACGSSKHSSSPTSPASTTSTSVGASPSAAGGSPADAATTAAVTTTFVTLFNGAAPLDQRIALLQNSSTFAAALQAQASSPLLKLTSATVSNVTLVRPNVANVTYTFLLSGTPLLSNQAGTAVQVDGGWKVSASTFCALLSAQGQAPASCTQATVTALPS